MEQGMSSIIISIFIIFLFVPTVFLKTAESSREDMKSNLHFATMALADSIEITNVNFDELANGYLRYMEDFDAGASNIKIDEPKLLLEFNNILFKNAQDPDVYNNIQSNIVAKILIYNNRFVIAGPETAVTRDKPNILGGASQIGIFEAATPTGGAILDVTSPINAKAIRLNQGVGVHKIESPQLSLATGKDYTVEFDYWSSGADAKFNVDFISSVPVIGINPIARSTAQHYVWKVKSNSEHILDSSLTFNYDGGTPTPANIFITNIVMYEGNDRIATYDYADEFDRYRSGEQSQFNPSYYFTIFEDRSPKDGNPDNNIRYFANTKNDILLDMDMKPAKDAYNNNITLSTLGLTKKDKNEQIIKKINRVISDYTGGVVINFPNPEDTKDIFDNIRKRELNFFEGVTFVVIYKDKDVLTVRDENMTFKNYVVSGYTLK